jgi:hypothetical protein
MNHQFQLPGSYKKWTYGLIGAGILALLYGIFFLHPFDAVSHDAGHGAHASTGGTRFWAVLLQNSVFFLLVAMRPCSYLCYHHGDGRLGSCFQKGFGSHFRVVPILSYHIRHINGHCFRQPYRYLSLAG